MRKLTFAAAAAVVLIFSASPRARAQSEDAAGKFEVGGQLTLLGVAPTRARRRRPAGGRAPRTEAPRHSRVARGDGG